jgi:hypothetical protein
MNKNTTLLIFFRRHKASLYGIIFGIITGLLLGNNSRFIHRDQITVLKPISKMIYNSAYFILLFNVFKKVKKKE